MGCSSNPKIVKNFPFPYSILFTLTENKNKRINAIMQVD